jgi:large subunit ribosomal protein L28
MVLNCYKKKTLKKLHYLFLFFYKNRSTKLWRPKILKLIFYSEILDKYYALTCTRRTLELIEEEKGFDNYILKTHQVDLKSDIGMELKREMLITLAKKETNLYPNDKQKQETIYNRYKAFAIPVNILINCF